jgi:23S rRNA (guanine2445-N2)-methyltransferase / 23S rRNA (guanine2069-N7)-methyltransferase
VSHAGASADADTGYFATCARGLELLLVDELTAIGAVAAREALAGVHFRGGADLGLRACLWSRLASRILLPVAQFPAVDADALYRGVAAVDWSAHLDPDRTFAIDAKVRASAINQGMFAGQRAKDAIVDQMRDRFGRRPNIDADAPDLRLSLRIVRDQATLSVDLAGQPLHRRGWRQGQGEAPLKETVAAAMLMRAGWPALAAQGRGLLDPFCGIGTIVIEAAWMAADIAPGLLRGQPGCTGWLGFDADAWTQLLSEARERRVRGLAQLQAPLRGSDQDPALLAHARTHADLAGVADVVAFARADALQLPAPTPAPGLVISNLPFGARLGDAASTVTLYRRLGEVLRLRFVGGRAALLTLADGRGRALGLRAQRRYALANGALECELLLIDIPDASSEPGADFDQPRALSEGAQMVANRLAKNLKALRRRLQREQIACYRLYDADLPEYAAAIDVYDGHAVVQEYQAPATIPEETARRRLGELVRATRQVLALERDRVVVKTRRRQRAGDQYQAQAPRRPPLQVVEGGLRFEVRLDDYLDTGLYLDHRLVRAWIGAHAKGRAVLNLFCYTGAATVHAAAGGARSTTSVDLSATYLAWAARNLGLNGYAGDAHTLVQADVLRWLASGSSRYGLIYVDPPTFSNSKRAEDFDVQHQHVELLLACARRLEPDGVIVFSNHFRRFRIDRDALAPWFSIEDASAQMLPFDFARDPRIHQVFFLRLRSAPIQ